MIKETLGPDNIPLGVCQHCRALFQTPNYDGQANARSSAGAIRSPERGAVTFSTLCEALQLGEPDLVHSLLVDGEEALVTLRLREAVLFLAVACEVAANEFLDRKGLLSDPAIKKLITARRSFAQKRFLDIPTHLSIPSLRDDDSVTYDLIELLYRARNAVAHASELEFTRNDVDVIVTPDLASLMLDAATRATDWLRGR